jgi:hypothetical protein
MRRYSRARAPEEIEQASIGFAPARFSAERKTFQEKE